MALLVRALGELGALSSGSSCGCLKLRSSPGAEQGRAEQGRAGAGQPRQPRQDNRGASCQHSSLLVPFNVCKVGAVTVQC